MCPSAWTFLDGVVDEIVAVAQRRNIPLARAEAGAFLRSVAEEARNHEPSMLIDIRNGRETEIECLNGAVLRECERHGIAAPHNRALYAMIRVMEQIARHAIRRCVISTCRFPCEEYEDATCRGPQAHGRRRASTL